MRRKKLSKRSRIRHSVLDAIGNTPLLRIRELGDKIKPEVEIWAKLEMFNPGGSVKRSPRFADD